jgi:hypothetical protein
MIGAKLGKPLNGKAPLGYHQNDKKIIPHPLGRAGAEACTSHMRGTPAGKEAWPGEL